MTPAKRENDDSKDEGNLVEVCGVSKKFCGSLKHSMAYGVNDVIKDLLGISAEGQPLRTSEFWALRNVSFQLKRGECLGLIGHNGAGKTTLLKILNGLMKPDSGSVKIKGRVGAMIALGAGFNPILSGRENIYINGAVLGLNRYEIDKRLDEIIDFSEIRNFIDAPVQGYSTGMKVRLGFSVASALDPDVLILDEVLSVGDVHFAIKCMNRMREISRKAAVIFVSHGMSQIATFCNRLLVLKNGQCAVDTNDIGQGISTYYDLINPDDRTSGSMEAQLTRFAVYSNGQPVASSSPIINSGSDVEIELEVEIAAGIEAAIVMVSILDLTQTLQLASFPLVDPDGRPRGWSSGVHTMRIPLGKLELAAAKYNWLFSVHNKENGSTLFRKQGLAPFQIISPHLGWAKFIRPVSLLPQNSGSSL